ncbi:FdtA/QdtA family cupin domain-containing protein [Flavihumibacter sp. RY-1]|uniref:FdtA/QdtA family cupin domain-containing protein n=2 Tax=Flavihumibacter fluminis TaxID=2909236 RepID=A0ABS9BNL4_9BACT|nr:FdtA/QdtA family cupin domain-containing protein [Flavihumibacter fluminis]
MSIERSEIMGTSTVFDCTILELPKISMDSGSITSINNKIDIPFNVERVYYLYDVPAGVERGGHAHRNLYQLIIPIAGSFDIVLSDSKHRRTFSINRPNYGLLIIPGIWRELNNFSSGSICIVLASAAYDENDYIRSYEEFLNIKSKI